MRSNEETGLGFAVAITLSSVIMRDSVKHQAEMASKGSAEVIQNICAPVGLRLILDTFSSVDA